MESSIRTQEVNPAKMTMLFKKQFELCKVVQGQTSRCSASASPSSLNSLVVCITTAGYCPPGTCLRMQTGALGVSRHIHQLD